MLYAQIRAHKRPLMNVLVISSAEIDTLRIDQSHSSLGKAKKLLLKTIMSKEWPFKDSRGWLCRGVV